MLEKYLLCFACAKLEKDLVQLVKDVQSPSCPLTLSILLPLKLPIVLLRVKVLFDVIWQRHNAFTSKIWCKECLKHLRL